MSSCVLAYSGGLDTSVILGWLLDEGYEVHCAYVDLGQPCEDREAILKKARDCGAASARIVDAREELCRDFAFPVLGWQAKYEGVYLLGTSIARPLISKCCLQVAVRSEPMLIPTERLAKETISAGFSLRPRRSIRQSRLSRRGGWKSFDSAFPAGPK